MPEVELRAAVDADVAPLVAILNEPSVARWWRGNDAGTVRNLDFTFVVLVDGEIAGLMLYEDEKDPEYPARATIALRSTPPPTTRTRSRPTGRSASSRSA